MGMDPVHPHYFTPSIVRFTVPLLLAQRRPASISCNLDRSVEAY